MVEVWYCYCRKIIQMLLASRVLLLSPAGFYFATKGGDDCGKSKKIWKRKGVRNCLG